jgi:ribonuclease P protein component
MNPSDHSFGKEHRLCGKKRIDRLFAEGRSFFAYPFRCVWTATDPAPDKAGAPVQILISVGKKNHKRAVARNKLKRRIREACRLNRYGWADISGPDGRIVTVALIYTSKEILEYSVIEHGVVKVFSEIRKRLAPGADLPVRAAD